MPETMIPYKIILAEDNLKFRRYVRELLEDAVDLKVVGEAGNGLELLDLLKKGMPDMIILDLSMPRMSGLETLSHLNAQHPQVKVLILTMHSTPAYLKQAISAGAHGYLPKDGTDTELLAAIDLIRREQQYISPIMGGKLR